MNEPITVLVVDDDFRVAGLHRDIVAGHPGFAAMEPVGSAAEARAAIARRRPDLLLVDLYLPDGSGIELLRTSDADGIVVSAADDPPSIRRALRAGAVSYLIKPFDRRALSDRLDRYARFRNLLADRRTLAQDDLDRALSVLHGERSSLSRSATEQLVLAALGAGEASATEVGERVGISRATAQRHLAALAAKSAVEVSLRYGSTGRPEHRYAVRG